MLLTITLILIAMVSLAALEIWLFSRLGERDDQRRIQERERARSSEVGAGLKDTSAQQRTLSPPRHAA